MPTSPHTTRSALLAAVLASVAAAATPGMSLAQWTTQQSPTSASLRGLSAVNDSVVWASGTRGTFMWTSSGGTEWHAGVVPGAESLDFRDVHAVSSDTAFLMAAGQDTARIYMTTDRGEHWHLQYDDTSKGAFLDAIAFFDSSHGLALGDPVDGHFVLLQTSDAGEHWSRIPPGALPPALTGEAAFAASGTALVTCSRNEAWIATGGAATSRVFRTRDRGRSWLVSETPVKAGSSAAGIFSLACRDSLHGVAVGGNYMSPDSTAVSVALTNDGGATWEAIPASAATGYLSGVAYLHPGDGSELIAVGTGGTALSRDGGRTWKHMDTLSLNVVAPASHGKVWAAGERGRLVILGPTPPAR